MLVMGCSAGAKPVAGSQHSRERRTKTSRPYQALQDKGSVVESWKRGAVWVFTVWACSRAGLTVVGVLAREWLGQRNSVGNVQQFFGIGTGYQWLDIWGAWDTRWYYQIAETGYAPEGDAVGYANYAFFPLYPWITRVTAELVGNTYLAGIIVSNLAILLGAIVFFRLLELEKNRTVARRGVLFLFLFPTSYVFSCMMTESLFICLTISSWYFARRGSWHLACGLAGLSAMTRSFGVLLGPFLFWEYLQQRQWRLKTFNLFQILFSIVRSLDLKVLWFALIPSGLAVFMWVCWQVTGNPLAFIQIQDAWAGGATGVNPFTLIVRTLGTAGLTVGAFGRLMGVLTLMTTAAVIIIGRRKVNPALVLWSLVTIFLYMSSHNNAYFSMMRYLVVVFPLYMILASYKLPRSSLLITVIGLALLQAVSMAFWTNGFQWAI